MQDATGIAELSRPDFLAGVGQFLAIYAAAMGARDDELPSRQAIMERHTGNPGFRAIAVYSGEPSRIVAFTYGFHGQQGQWWHDVVRSGITMRSGAAAAAGVAYINSIANIAGFVGNYVMGWLRDLTGSFDSGLLVIAAVCNLAALATLCIHHDKELEQTPIIDDTPPLPGTVAEIV